jgi:hypothetical protein
MALIWNVYAKCPEPVEMVLRGVAKMDEQPAQDTQSSAPDSPAGLALRLAEEALRLVNASPRTPRREELAGVLEPLVRPWRVMALADPQVCCGDFERCMRACYHRGYKAREREEEKITQWSGVAIAAKVIEHEEREKSLALEKKWLLAVEKRGVLPLLMRKSFAR